MSINAYVGLQGSGKSYQVVGNVIIPAVAAGRRVVTNIHGIETEKIRAYLFNKGLGDPKSYGEVVVVEDEDVFKEGFFPAKYREVEGVKVVDDAASFVKGGDLVCLDESWKFYGTGKKVTPEHFAFFREHRHFRNPTTNATCDLVLLTQDIGDLTRSVRSVIEVTFRTVKLKSLGLDRQYRVEQYSGSKCEKRALVDTKTPLTYDLEICALYQSHAGGVGKEVTIDKRQNLLKRPGYWLGFALVFVVGLWGIWHTVTYFTGRSAAPRPAVASNQAVTAPGQTASQSSAAVMAQPVTAQPAAPAVPPFSSEWRIAGTMALRSERFVVLVGEAGRVRLEHPSMFTFVAGRPSVGVVEGQRVTAFSGPQTSAPSAATLAKVP